MEKNLERGLYLWHETQNQFFWLNEFTYKKYCKANGVRSLADCPELEIQCKSMEPENIHEVNFKVKDLSPRIPIKFQFVQWTEHKFNINEEYPRRNWPEVD